MKKMSRYSWLVIVAAIFWGCSNTTETSLEFDRLLCNYAENPIGIDTKEPNFSWVISSMERGQKQTAYQIRVAKSTTAFDKGEFIWDSKKIMSDQTFHHKYKGEPLTSKTNYYWNVCVWDVDGNKFDSPITDFSTAFLTESDWMAEWVGANSSPEPKPLKGFFMDVKEEKGLHDTVTHSGRSILLRNEFDITKKIKSARLFITGLGFYEALINGKNVGNSVLAPAKTPYHKYILYDVYDVTELISKGDNAIGIQLGNGWYNPYKRWWKEYRMQWFGYKKALAQMHVTFEDGTEQIITTNDQWKTAPGPVVFNCVYDGEVYDANASLPGWTDPGFDDANWSKVTIMDSPKASLIADAMPPIQRIEIKKPKEITKPKSEMMVYDFGQNFTGWIRIDMQGKKGDTLQIRFSEELYEDGTLNFTCNERAKATVKYILKGDDTETYETRFSYFGFQFVELTSSNKLPEISSAEAMVVHSANRQVGSFETNHELINKMHHATVWSQKSNMLGYPMDCPQRDERLGWLGDAQVTAEEAMFNFDMALFYQNFFRGIRANQDEETGDIPIISPRPYIRDEGIEWSSSYFTMVWDYYKYYGDEAVLQDNYQTMVRYLNFLDEISNNYILPKGWIGDWGSHVKGWKEGEPKSAPTAFYYYNATILQKIAQILALDEDAKKFNELANAIKVAYNSNYFNSDTNNYNDGSQMANAFPLYLGLVPADKRSAVLENIVKDVVEKNDTHLTTGVLGTKYLIEALSQAGRADVSWALATQTTYPSWAEMMKRFNTMCEFWTLKQSHNHVMMGSIDSWFYKALGGIQLMEAHPAYEQFIIKPFVTEGLTNIKASTETIRGLVSSSWNNSTDGFNLEVEIPFNSTALVFVPAEEDQMIIENGAEISESNLITFKEFKDGYQVFNVPSGKYNFSY